MGNANSLIGMKVILKRRMLGENVGAIGYVFNEYPDFDDPEKLGVQVIFEKGGFDGFSVEEQNLYLEFKEIDARYSGYKFVNVSCVIIDYRNGYWNFRRILEPIDVKHFSVICSLFGIDDDENINIVYNLYRAVLTGDSDVTEKAINDFNINMSFRINGRFN